MTSPGYNELLDEQAIGVHHIAQFLGATALTALQTELNALPAVAWHDAHDVYQNQRGLTIVQNHDTYALKLSHGDPKPLTRLPQIQQAMSTIQTHIDTMAATIPSLDGWLPDEASIHRYDNAEVGLSFHKDQPRFCGLIAILSLDGVCDLAINRADGVRYFTARPGDLMLLRAPGLIETDIDPRPEHAVVNLQTPTRTSLMLRANNRPDERMKAFRFVNW